MYSSDPTSSVVGEEVVVLAVVEFEIQDGMVKGLFHGHIPASFLPNQAAFSSKDVPMGESMAAIVPRDTYAVEDQHDGKIDPFTQQGFFTNDDLEALREEYLPFFERHGGKFCSTEL
jgi:hypothetical protein